MGAGLHSIPGPPEFPLYVEDIGEGVPRKVVTTQDNLSLPVWSQDCRWLFASDTTPIQYRFAATGGPAERFSEHPSNYALVVGDRVVFNALQADGVVLWSKPVDGGPEAPLKNMPRLSYAGPRGLQPPLESTRRTHSPNRSP